MAEDQAARCIRASVDSGQRHHPRGGRGVVRKLPAILASVLAWVRGYNNRRTQEPVPLHKHGFGGARMMDALLALGIILVFRDSLGNAADAQ